MKARLYLSLIILAILGFNTQIVNAQNAEVNIIQDSKIPKLLDLKSKMIQNNDLKDRYKIQIMGYGNLNDANSILDKYKAEIGIWPGTIAYQTPNYKVWVGHFTNRLEADRALLKIHHVFPNAFVFKPKE